MSNTETAYFKQKMVEGSKPLKDVTDALESDLEFRGLVQHVLNPSGQRLSEFVALYGLNKETIKAQGMTASDISRHVENVKAANREDPNGPASSWRAKPIPQKFILD